MELTVGEVLTGTVKTITKFGAFVTLPENQTGLVHISEVAHTYVNDIREHLAEGQEVKVVVLSLENGKINLSIKKAQTPPPKAPRPREADHRQPSLAVPPAEPASFDDMLKRFMADSASKISGIRQYSDHKTKTRRR